MHWHGQTQLKSFVMDGVPKVTQCLIGPGEQYTYKFIARNTGTHWYHAHSGVQRTDGVYGVFIVTNQMDRKYDAEFNVLIQDCQQ